MTSWVGTMLLGVTTGLAIAIGLALLIVIYESAFPHTALLGRVGNTTIYRNVKQFPNSQVGMVVFQQCFRFECSSSISSEGTQQ